MGHLTFCYRGTEIPIHRKDKAHALRERLHNFPVSLKIPSFQFQELLNAIYYVSRIGCNLYYFIGIELYVVKITIYFVSQVKSCLTFNYGEFAIIKMGIKPIPKFQDIQPYFYCVTN